MDRSYISVKFTQCVNYMYLTLELFSILTVTETPCAPVVWVRKAGLYVRALTGNVDTMCSRHTAPKKYVSDWRETST